MGGTGTGSAWNDPVTWFIKRLNWTLALLNNQSQLIPSIPLQNHHSFKPFSLCLFHFNSNLSLQNCRQNTLHSSIFIVTQMAQSLICSNQYIEGLPSLYRVSLNLGSLSSPEPACCNHMMLLLSIWSGLSPVVPLLTLSYAPWCLRLFTQFTKTRLRANLWDKANTVRKRDPCYDVVDRYPFDLRDPSIA